MSKALLEKLLNEIEIIEQKENKSGEVLFSIKRDALRQSVRDHASVLNQKFSNIDLNKVVISVQLILRDAITKSLGRRDVAWTNSTRTMLIAGNIGKLRRLMTSVKQVVRQTARDSINTTKRKLDRDDTNTVAASIVISGTDVRNISKGGDIRVKTDLKKGVIVKTPQAFNKDNDLGIQVSQTFGPGIDDEEILDLFSSKSLRQKLVSSKKEKVKRQVILKTNTKYFSKSKKQGSISLAIIESGSSVRKRSARTTNIKRKLQSIIQKQYKSNKFLDVVKSYTKGIEELFLTGRLKTSSKGKRTTTKLTRTTTTEIPVYTPDFTPTRMFSRQRKRDKPNSLRDLINRINRRLHDQIQKNMGKGSSRTTLNYRTGRFARSAIVQDLYRTTDKNKVFAKVKYMRYPYGVFEKGGRLNPPVGRDPKLIFGKSIRQLLIEEKIANLNRVEVILSG